MPDEIHHRFAKLKPAKPVVPMVNVLQGNDFGRSAEKFTFDPDNR